MFAKTELWSRAAVWCVFLIASVAVAPAVADAVPPGKSVIYLVTRDTGTFSSVFVSVNGKLVGAAKSASHFLIVANPGVTEIGSAGSGRGTYSLTTASGGRYYVTHSINMSGVPEFRALSETDGQAAVAQTRKLAEVGALPPLASESRSEAAFNSKSGDTEQSGSASPASIYDKHAIAIILKGGSYKLAEAVQPMGGIDALAETNSSSASGLEVEWRHPKGFALGGEIFLFKNKWAIDDPFIPETGYMATAVYTFNSKYYFNIANFVYPYAGLGVGFAVTAFEGEYTTGAGGGFAYQGLAGIEFRFKYVGVNLQFKSLVANVKSTQDDGTTETNKVGGTGGLVGLAIHIPIR